MKPSKDCIELIKHFEGFYNKAYLCPADKWTIGYGTVMYPDGSMVKEGDICTEPQAEVWLMHEVNEKAAGVNRMVKVDITQCQADALISFAYNLGLGALAGSTLLKKPNGGYNYGAAAEFDKWVHGGGKVLPGLVRRRDAEKTMFLGKGWKEFLK